MVGACRSSLNSVLTGTIHWTVLWPLKLSNRHFFSSHRLHAVQSSRKWDVAWVMWGRDGPVPLQALRALITINARGKLGSGLARKNPARCRRQLTTSSQPLVNSLSSFCLHLSRVHSLPVRDRHKRILVLKAGAIKRAHGYATSNRCAATTSGLVLTMPLISQQVKPYSKSPPRLELQGCPVVFLVLAMEAWKPAILKLWTSRQV